MFDNTQMSQCKGAMCFWLYTMFTRSRLHRILPWSLFPFRGVLRIKERAEAQRGQVPCLRSPGSKDQACCYTAWMTLVSLENLGS